MEIPIEIIIAVISLIGTIVVGWWNYKNQKSQAKVAESDASTKIMNMALNVRKEETDSMKQLNDKLKEELKERDEKIVELENKVVQLEKENIELRRINIVINEKILALETRIEEVYKNRNKIE